MSVSKIVLLCIASVIGLFLIFEFIYESTGFGKWFFDRILGWHKPVDKVERCGPLNISTCKYCGKRITQDSQGNWFEVDEK